MSFFYKVFQAFCLGVVKTQDCLVDGKSVFPAFSPFPKMFSKGFLHRVAKSHDCLEKC